jgi:hypothetical protein
LLLVCWFAHLVAFALAVLGLVVLVAAGARGAPPRRQALHLAILLPQAALPLWFLASSAGTMVPGPSLAARLAFGARLGALFPHQPELAGGLLAATFLALAIATAVRRERVPGRHAFLLLALAFGAAFLLAPDAAAGGSILPLRLSFLPFVALVPWLAAPRRRAAMVALAAGLGAVAVWQAAALARVHRAMEGEMEAFVRGLQPAEPGSRVLPIVLRPSGTLRERAFAHLAARAAVERSLVDWSDYQATKPYFPLRFRAAEDERPDLYTVEAQPQRYPVARHLAVVDYVYTWRLPEGGRLRRRLGRFYEPVAASGDGLLWRRRTPAETVVLAEHIGRPPPPTGEPQPPRQLRQARRGG